MHVSIGDVGTCSQRFSSAQLRAHPSLPYESYFLTFDSKQMSRNERLNYSRSPFIKKYKKGSNYEKEISGIAGHISIFSKINHFTPKVLVSSKRVSASYKTICRASEPPHRCRAIDVHATTDPDGTVTLLTGNVLLESPQTEQSMCMCQ